MCSSCSCPASGGGWCSSTPGVAAPGLLEQCPVVLDGSFGGVSPAPAVDDPLTSCGTDATSTLGVVQRSTDARGERLAVGGGRHVTGLAVGARDLGDGTAGGRHERAAGAHRLDRREREALVE